MVKRKNLAGALMAQDAPETSPAPVQTPPAQQQRGKPVRSAVADERTDRDDKVIISGWFPPAVKFELEEIRLKRSRELGRKITLQELQAEALNDLFKKYGHPELAPTSRKA